MRRHRLAAAFGAIGFLVVLWATCPAGSGTAFHFAILSDRADAFSPEEIEFLERLGERLSVGITRAEDLEQLEMGLAEPITGPPRRLVSRSCSARGASWRYAASAPGGRESMPTWTSWPSSPRI